MPVRSTLPLLSPSRVPTPAFASMLCAAMAVASAANAQPAPAPATAAVPPAATPTPTAALPPAVPDEGNTALTEPGPKDALAALVALAKAGDVDAFKRGLTPQFVDVVERYQALMKDAPRDAQARYSWVAFVAAFAHESPTVVTVKDEGATASVETVRSNGDVGQLKFARASDGWKLDVQPTLAAQVARAEAARAARATAAPTHPSNTPAHPTAAPTTGAASQPAIDPRPDLTASVDSDVARAPMPSPPPGPFDPGQPLHYVWYAPDYTFIAASSAAYLFDVYTPILHVFQDAGTPSLIGPSFNLNAPVLEELNDSRLNGVIGNPYLTEKVTTFSAAVFGVGALGALAVSDVRHLDFHHTHAFTTGALTAVLGALTATELLKVTVRRLRPDFRERYTRAACNDVVSRPDELDCTLAEDGFGLDRSDLDDGMKSFSSGHAAFAFAAAMYGSLYLGGEFIWGEDSNMVTTPLAALGATGLMAGASFIAASRLADNKHHVEDVAVGSMLGAGIAAATYFLHFDLDGNARWRGFAVAPVSYEEGGGLSVSGKF